MNVRDDEGGVTVLAAFALAALLVVVIGVVHVGSAVGGRHRAQAAADLSALAAAGALDRGVVDACAAGGVIVERMGAVMNSCVVEGWDVVMEVSITLPLGQFGLRDAVAAARAGPVQ